MPSFNRNFFITASCPMCGSVSFFFSPKHFNAFDIHFDMIEIDMQR